MLVVFFFNDTATTEIYTLSLHDALPIFARLLRDDLVEAVDGAEVIVVAQGNPAYSAITGKLSREQRDRKSTRLNSSHANISYAVFCLKKKKKRHEGVEHSPWTAHHLTAA